MVETPVMFPPGRLRLAMRPAATGSFKPVPTMGTVRDRSCTAAAARLVETTTALGWRASNSAARGEKRLELLSAHQVSNT